MHKLRLFVLLIMSLALVTSCSSKSKELKKAKASSAFKHLKERGHIICGVNAQLPGFGFKSGKDSFSGFDIDLAKALSAAIFGDETKIKFATLTTNDRFESFESGDVDFIVRNTSVNLKRELSYKGAFSRIYFYDGLGIMVHSDANISNLYQLQDHSIGVLRGSSAEFNLTRQLAARNLEGNITVYESLKELLSAYRMGHVKAICSDKTALAAMKATFPAPQSSWIMDVTLSKEPLAILLPDDEQLERVINWTINALILAEEYGITSQNVERIAKSSTLPQVRQLLGLEGNIGEALGLSNDWAYQVILRVGNYKEIYDRNLGDDTIFSIPRGYNKLYLQKGLLYSPPLE